MKFIKRLRSGYRRFKNGQPGHRFTDLYRRLRAGRRRWLQLVVGIGGGVLLTLGGFFLGLVPGVPGFVLGIMGIALLAAQFRVSARGCDLMEVALRRKLQQVRAERRIDNGRAPERKPAILPLQVTSRPQD